MKSMRSWKIDKAGTYDKGVAREKLCPYYNRQLLKIASPSHRKSVEILDQSCGLRSHRTELNWINRPPNQASENRINLGQ